MPAIAMPNKFGEPSAFLLPHYSYTIDMMERGLFKCECWNNKMAGRSRLSKYFGFCIDMEFVDYDVCSHIEEEDYIQRKWGRMTEVPTGVGGQLLRWGRLRWMLSDQLVYS